MAISKIITGSLTDDAVTSAKIGTDQVGADALSSSAISGAVDIPANSVGQSELSIDLSAQSVPHIIPGVLQPAVAGKLLNGANHSGAYGTAQTQSGGDGHSYYYTDIKGSKPIKDPRIGGHFGSQRYKLKSLQLLEQETATHGKEVKCADGREWIRFVDGNWSWHTDYDGNGHYIAAYSDCTNNLFEITGYFNDINFLVVTDPSRATNIDVSVNGTLMVDNSTTLGGVTTVANPLHSRYVDAGSVINGGSLTANGAGQSGTLASNLGTTPKINTIKFLITSGSSKTFYIQAIELIAQDTSNRNNIQIPSQNVVSYGKKFTVSGTPHYGPFSTKTDGSAWTSPTSGNNTANSAASWPTNIDTAHSLGLENWVNGSSYYRPYNGGRVVKYVDSTGTIKTAVTVMPPNARSIANAANLTGGAEKGDDGTDNSSAAVANSNYQPTFTDQTIATAQDLHEVAKTFNWREFGNGAANQGAGGTRADASMLNADDDIAYTMDDGTTSFCGKDVDKHATHDSWDLVSSGETAYYTFIGTGFSIQNVNTNTLTYTYDISVDGVLVANDVTLNGYKWVNLCQNLPYGTHIIRFAHAGSSGAQVATFNEVSFHQPKRPSIPEDAVILADYMLMADYVGVPASDSGQHSSIPKGTRMCSSSRDAFYDTASGTLLYAQNDPASRERTHRVQYNDISSGSKEGPVITYFGHPKMSYGLASDTDASPRYELKMNDSTTNVTGVSTSGSVSGSEITGFIVSGYSYQHISSTKSDGTLGANTAKISAYPADSSDNHLYFGDAYIPTPIHTSSHYQAFETPYLHELVGGDRNMEQNNLVCSPDGKTWDEVTRDTSYIGGLGINTDVSASQNTVTNLLFTEWRGKIQGANSYNKGFAIAYDRVICLIPGRYRIFYSTHADSGTSSAWSEIRVNGLEAVVFYTYGSSYTNPVGECVVDLARGDFVQVLGSAKADLDCQSIFNIQQV